MHRRNYSAFSTAFFLLTCDTLPFFPQTFTSTKKAKSAPFVSKYTSRRCRASAWTPWPFTLQDECSSTHAATMLSAASPSRVAAADRIGSKFSRRLQSRMMPSTKAARVRACWLTAFVHSGSDFSYARLRCFCTVLVIFCFCRGWRILLRASVDGKRPRNQHREGEQQQQVQDAF